MKYSTFKKMFLDRKKRDKIYCSREYWDSKAEMYEGQAVSMWPNENLDYFYNKEQIDLIESILPNVNGLEIMDIGCGTGRMSRYFADRGAEVLGIDFSPGTIDIARSISPSDNPTYKEMSIFDLKLDKSFDLIFSCATITCACKNRKELLEAMITLKKTLRKRGKIILLEPIHYGFLHRVLNMKLREFCEVMEEAGFEIKKVVNIHFWPMRLVLAFISWPRFLTAIGYYTGRLFIRLSKNGILGDYKAIYASSSK
jgi:2-polyprenyl-3-methyl-5-hydroxy-6-metoxy-1,4-benzoquinol methylase